MSSALRHEGIDRVDCVEISPAVLEAVERFFQQETRPLDDPRLRLRIGDGRLHLAMSDRRYDVIISHPGNPWMAGSSALFTPESFQQMRDCLGPGGVAAVWLPGWMSPEVVRTFIVTFHSVFEQMDIWEGGSLGHYILTGYLEPTRFDPIEVEERMGRPDLAEEFRRFSILDAADLLGHFIADGEGAGRLPGPVRISTDDLDLIGTRSARDLLGNHAVEVLTGLSSVRVPVANRLAPARDDPRRERFLSRSRQISVARRLILDAMGARERAAALARTGREDEARLLFREAEELLRQAREINPRDPAVAQPEVDGR